MKKQLSNCLNLDKKKLNGIDLQPKTFVTGALRSRNVHDEKTYIVTIVGEKGK